MSDAAAPLGVRALGVFFIFGTCMSGISFASLLTPCGALEVIWRLNPPAREAFTKMGARGEKLTTPLQFEYYLTRALEEAYKVDQKPVGADIDRNCARQEY